jgi:hypothetical protein
MVFKKILLVSWLFILASGIGYVFWYNEWKFSLPTPVPDNYHAIDIGAKIAIKELPEVPANNKPLFLHFFNPDCPCSRFNVAHFRSLDKEFGDRMNFVVVALCRKDRYTESAIRKKFGFDMPIVFDSSYAAACGVYSTPQAAIIDTDQRLYYRGNYNKTRYCTDKKTNYAQIAIESLLSDQNNIDLGPAATKSYGCTLPVCTK